MIPLNPRHRRARYDENGDIILEDDLVPSEVSSEAVAEISFPSAPAARWHEAPPTPQEIFDLENELPPLLAQECVREETQVHSTLEDVRKLITEDVLEEGLRQYRASAAGAKPLLRELKNDTSTFLRRFSIFLAQPVWIPLKGKRFKQTSRGALFFTDIVRFGGAFAFIFIGLFTVLNYQSFWEIGKARVWPLIAPPAVEERAMLASALQDKLKQMPGLAVAGGATEGDLLSVLPMVGPPENRVVIPKLDLNVPIVNPRYEALLKGDWPQVEKDIQDSLQEGVVHYPGTARPGQAGNFFVTGHSSYYPWAPGKFKTVFARLHALEVGDEYWVYFGGDKYRYVVRSKKEVSPSNITVLDQPTDQRLSTLMTCTPVGTTLRRLVVVAEEVDPSTGKPLIIGERTVQPLPQFNLEALPI